MEEVTTHNIPRPRIVAACARVPRDPPPIMNISPEISEADREDTRSWIIYKVPNKLREIRPAAYTPQIVSIGPFHHGKSNLKAMAREGLMNELKKEDGKLVERIKRSYEEDSFEPENEKKYWTDKIPMILQDAFFIFELFLRNHETQPPDREDDEKKKQRAEKIKKYSGDYIWRSPWVKAATKQDLILLENQLPFFVLIHLFDSIFKHRSKNIDGIPDYLPELKNNEGEPCDFLIQITCEFFIDYYRFGKPCPKESSENKPLFKYSEQEKKQLVSEMKQIKHFTDLIRKFMCDETVMYPKSSEALTHCLYSARQLDNAGVMFGRPMDATYLASINTWPDIKDDDKCCQWWNGRGCCWLNGCCWINCLQLKIPQLKVQDNTECIFRNVMALEQFVYPDEPRICNYIFLLDQLIDTVEDVDLLVDKRIIENWLGTNKAVAALVNKLCDHIVTPRFLYTDICDKLNKHQSKRLNVARSTLKRVYFKDIWTGCGTVVGLVFLVFSLFSTYSTIKNLFFV
nr:UPF0481 protein At3g47200-like [Ziziphus jujuba var. spinosa]